jgi:phosphinothricin acetyltransferase
MVRIKTIDFPDALSMRHDAGMARNLSRVVAPGRDPIAPPAIVLRDAVEIDLPQIGAIWNHEIVCTEATTDTEPRDETALVAWLARDNRYPAVVAARGAEVLAFGAIAPWRSKPAFARTVEDSVYVRRGHRGAGLGRLVLQELVRRASEHGHRSILARVTANNVVSLRLHEAFGFRSIGVERETAFKLGKWLDVVTLQRLLDPV